MKSLYYRTQKISDRSLITIALGTLAVLVALHFAPQRTEGWLYDRMMEASRKTDQSFEAIKARRVELKHKMFKSQDPARTGMLGPSATTVTTLPGHLDSKQTSINANFAAVAMKYLVDAGVREGDYVGIGITGSFPALNIAVLQAAESLDLKPIIISSVASSQYGANNPEMMWPDMEKLLFDQGLLKHRSLAISRGGFRDNAADMNDDVRVLLDEAIRRGGIPMLEVDSLEESIDKRMTLMKEAAGGKPIAAYINVGGGSSSVGGTKGNDEFGSGLILPSDAKWISQPIDSVAMRFLNEGVPLINMINAVTMAKRFGMPVASPVRPVVGDSTVFNQNPYRRWFAVLGGCVILLITWVNVRPPRVLVQRMQKLGWWPAGGEQPQWMV